ncbi:MAG: endonuclease III [Ignavibacteria bacterium]|nr:endonuclease III [Ignavibacteria bacterium]
MRPKRGRKSETPAKRCGRAAKILARLRKDFPKPKTALYHDNASQLLIATILSAQCTDERVNMVTKDLFKKYPSPKHFAEARQAELEQDIRSTGFYRMKTKSIIGCSRALVERHGGKVPKQIEDLVQLPGVGRKTANVVLGQAYGITSGVVVDTHVHRVAQRLGFTTGDDPETIEQDLMGIFEKKVWIDVGSVLILHGRRTCRARNPKCPECSVNDLCPSAKLFVKRTK